MQMHWVKGALHESGPRSAMTYPGTSRHTYMEVCKYPLTCKSIVLMYVRSPLSEMFEQYNVLF